MAGSPSVAPSAENAIESTESTNPFPNGIDPETADAETIKKYVKYHFQRYADNDYENYYLWNIVQGNFEHFKEEHFNKFDRDTWELVKAYCYQHGIWIDHNYGPGRTRASFMIKAINTEWELDWTLEQIKWVQGRYKHLSEKTLDRKRELMSIIESDNLNLIAANSRGLSADPRTQSYQDTRLQTPLHQSASPNPYIPQAPLSSQSPQFTQQISQKLPPSQSSHQTPHHQFQENSTNQYAKELTLLEKIYKDNDKFSGTGDNFGFKLTIFLDKCRRVGTTSYRVHSWSLDYAFWSGIDSLLCKSRFRCVV